MKKRVFSLFVAAALLVSSFSMTAFAAQSSEDTLRSQYSYTNNGYTLRYALRRMGVQLPDEHPELF